MNKKVIRLTESDLHRIVKESVQKILSEAINELDPRTLASAERKAREEGDPRASKFGEYAADSWNRDYGKDIYPYDNDGNYVGGDAEHSFMSYNPAIDNDADYVINHGIYGDDDFVDNSIYSPKSNITHKNLNISNEKPIHRGHSGISRTMRNGIGNKGIDVAKQMAQGNGKYINGKWQ
jgi:hypothetical protein